MKRAASITGGIAGASSILGSAQVCHSLCGGIIALLSVVGITLTGMPLMFLQEVALPFWLIALALFIIVAGMFVAGRHPVPPGLLLLNGGLLVAGVPFPALQDAIAFFWVAGGLAAITGVGMLVVRRRRMPAITTHP